MPVRSDLVAAHMDIGRRLVSSGARQLSERRNLLQGFARGLPDPQRLLAEKIQTLDDRAERLMLAARGRMRNHAAALETLGHRLPHPRQQYRLAEQALEAQALRLAPLSQRLLEQRRQTLASLVPRAPVQELRHAGQSLQNCGERLSPAVQRFLASKSESASASGRLLLSLSYKQTLARGYAVVRGPEGLLQRADQITSGMPLRLEFNDGEASAIAGKGDRPAKQSESSLTGAQGRLL